MPLVHFMRHAAATIEYSDKVRFALHKQLNQKEVYAQSPRGFVSKCKHFDWVRLRRRRWLISRPPNFGPPDFKNSGQGLRNYRLNTMRGVGRKALAPLDLSEAPYGRPFS